MNTFTSTHTVTVPATQFVRFNRVVTFEVTQDNVAEQWDADKFAQFVQNGANQFAQFGSNAAHMFDSYMTQVVAFPTNHFVASTFNPFK